MANNFPVEKSTYIDADEKTYRALSYDMFKSIHDSQSMRLTECSSRFDRHRDKISLNKDNIEKLEKRKLRDATFATGGGIIGGVLYWAGMSIKKIFTGG